MSASSLSALAHPSVPVCTVDVVLFTLLAGRLQVVLVQREGPPFAGAWALPGGYIHPQHDATALDAAKRVLRDKVGVAQSYLEQLATFSGQARDPRGWSLSVVYCALVPHDQWLATSPRDGWQLVDVQALPALAFDHADIIGNALRRVRNKSQYSSLPVYFCGEQFTLPQLQQVYEAVLGERLNKVSFRRKMDEMAMLEAVEGAFQAAGAHRPAQLYRLRPAYQLQLALTARGL